MEAELPTKFSCETCLGVWLAPDVEVTFRVSCSVHLFIL